MTLPTAFLESGGRFRDTLKAMMTDPGEFFRAAPREGPIGRVLWFGVACQTIGIAVMWLCMGLFFSVMFTMIPHIDPKAAQGMPPLWLFPLIFGGIALLSPVFAALGLIVTAVIDHVALSLLGGGQEFNITLRAVALSQGPMALGIIPLIGLQIGQIWALVLRVIAIKEMHQISTGKAIAVIVLPILVFFCLFFGLYIAMFLVFFGSMAAHGAH